MNLLRDLPNARAAEITEALAATPGLRIERIVSLGQTSALLAVKCGLRELGRTGQKHTPRVTSWGAEGRNPRAA